MTVAAESSIYGDSAYTDSTTEDDLMEADGIRLMIQRKSNAKRKDKPWIGYLKEKMHNW